MDASAPSRWVTAASAVLWHAAVVLSFVRRVDVCTVLSLALMCLMENLGLICILDCGFILCKGNIKENYGTWQVCSFVGKNKSNNQNGNEILVLLETVAVFLLIPV